MTDAAPISILILEDQGLVRAGMRALVQICEPTCQCHEASSYQEAIEKLTSKPYDIAFLDIDLKSEKSGLDVLKYIRAEGMEARAVMLSGRSERELVMQCLEAGASGYILKDLDSEGLFRRAIDTVFQGGIFLPATVLGRGGFSPLQTVASPTISLEALGLRGRVIEALYYLCQGLPNKTIAHKMGIAESTVRQDYVTTLFRAFGVARRTQLLVEISRRGVIVPSPSQKA